MIVLSNDVGYDLVLMMKMMMIDSAIDDSNHDSVDDNDDCGCNNDDGNNSDNDEDDDYDDNDDYEMIIMT